MKTRTAHEIIQNLGRAKQSTRTRRLHTFFTLSEPRKNYEDQKTLSRVVMRAPNQNVIDNLNNIHQKMKQAFSSMPDSGLEWLLGGSSEMSRGGFQDDDSMSRVNRFKQFLNTNPEKIPTQRLITGIETITTAMGYRAIHASWVESPYTPETKEQLLMDTKIRSLVLPFLRKQIGDVYLDRFFENIQPNSPKTKKEVVGKQIDVSSASEVEFTARKPKIKLDSRRFNYKTKKNTLSWPAMAKKGGIPVRGNTSGTCPLCMSAIEGLYSSGNSSSQDNLSDNDLKQLVGALLIPTFLRGDYHTFAETAAGIVHYLQERSIKNGEITQNNPVHPYDCYRQALEIMTSAVTSNKAKNCDSLTIQQAFKKEAQRLLASVKRVEKNELDEDDFNLIPAIPYKNYK